MDRRKIIANLLNIPPTLLGLAIIEAGTPIIDPPKSYPVIGIQGTLKRVAREVGPPQT